MQNTCDLSLAKQSRKHRQVISLHEHVTITYSLVLYFNVVYPCLVSYERPHVRRRVALQKSNQPLASGRGGGDGKHLAQVHISGAVGVALPKGLAVDVVSRAG